MGDVLRASYVFSYIILTTVLTSRYHSGQDHPISISNSAKNYVSEKGKANEYNLLVFQEVYGMFSMSKVV